jgi:hypothetical protein
MSSREKPDTRPSWTQIALGVTAGTIASVGITAVTTAGFALSFDSIRTVARAAYINVNLDWMLPVAIDGAMAVASVTAIVMQKLGRKPLYPWVVVLANVLISVGCNALHAYQGGGERPLPVGWAMAVSAIPALNLALSLHLAIELVMAVVKRSERPAKGEAEGEGFSQFAPTVIHGGTQPARPAPTQQVRTDGRTDGRPRLAPAISAPSLNGSQLITQQPAQSAKAAPTQPEWGGGKAAATVGEQSGENRTERVAAKLENTLRKPAYPLADDPNESVRKLARAYSRNPAKTNADLAKLAKVSEGTANRYMPKVRQAAVDAENADADEERALSALNLGPFAALTSSALTPVNGYSYTTPEEN